MSADRVNEDSRYSPLADSTVSFDWKVDRSTQCVFSYS